MGFFDSSAKSYSTLDSGQQSVEGNLVPQFNQNLAAGPSQYIYKGNLTAPITAGEQGVVDQNARINALAGNTYSQIGTYSPSDINNQFDTNIQAPAMRNWEQNVAPYLRESMPSFSSEQGNVLARALNTEQNNLDQMRVGYQQQGQVNALNALQGANQYYQGSEAIQAVPREIQQAGLDKQYTAFIQGNQLYQQNVNQMLNYLGIQTQALQPQSSPFQNVLAGIQTAANVASAMSGGGPGSSAGWQPSALEAFGGGTSPYQGPSSAELNSDPNQWSFASMAGA